MCIRDSKNMVTISLLDVLGSTVKEEEWKEGMSAEEEEGPAYDEHVWLSLKNAKTICAYLADQLGKIDSENAGTYQANEAEYASKLDELDNRYQTAVDSATHQTLLFGDRFPFRYLVDDYKLDYYAAFLGCSAETEASFETIVFLANKIDELGLQNVLTIEGSEHKIAETIIQNTKEKNQKLITLNSIQSVTSDDVKAGTTYLSIMQNNLEALKQALN